MVLFLQMITVLRSLRTFVTGNEVHNVDINTVCIKGSSSFSQMRTALIRMRVPRKIEHLRHLLFPDVRQQESLELRATLTFYPKSNIHIIAHERPIKNNTTKCDLQR